MDHYRRIYFEAINIAANERQKGFNMLKKLENILTYTAKEEDFKDVVSFTVVIFTQNGLKPS